MNKITVAIDTFQTTSFTDIQWLKHPAEMQSDVFHTAVWEKSCISTRH